MEEKPASAAEADNARLPAQKVSATVPAGAQAVEMEKVMSEIEGADGKDTAPRFESMTFGMILDRTFGFYSRNFRLLVGVMAAPEILGYLNALLLGRSLTGGNEAATLLFMPVYVMVNLLAFAVGTGAATVAISGLYLDRGVTVAGVYRESLRKLGAIMGAWVLASLLVSLGIIATMAVGGILFASGVFSGAAGAGAWVLMPLLFLAGVVWAVVLLVSYSLITPAILLESLSAPQSLKRSRSLTKGGRWPILGLMVLFHAVRLLLLTGLGYLAGRLGGPQVSFLGPGAGSIYHHLIAAPLSIVLSPIQAILIVLIYYNQRIRKEGFDLVLLAEALARE
jgi:hypothetical protein